jgi:hypothetical protein
MQRNYLAFVWRYLAATYAWLLCSTLIYTDVVPISGAKTSANVSGLALVVSVAVSLLVLIRVPPTLRKKRLRLFVISPLGTLFAATMFVPAHLVERLVDVAICVTFIAIGAGALGHCLTAWAHLRGYKAPLGYAETRGMLAVYSGLTSVGVALLFLWQTSNLFLPWLVLAAASIILGLLAWGTGNLLDRADLTPAV